ncbi:hypothetical protein CRV24_006302 [Beauveria bassiana]|nr:hypothetical protein CRV24_006302 [Beauveria bassiana]KAH8708699.1 hypothetical protein HC256_008638 [Beauveria bassiana]
MENAASTVGIRIGQYLDAVAYGSNDIRAGLSSRWKVFLQQFVYDFRIEKLSNRVILSSREEHEAEGLEIEVGRGPAQSVLPLVRGYH